MKYGKFLAKLQFNHKTLIQLSVANRCSKIICNPKNFPNDTFQPFRMITFFYFFLSFSLKFLDEKKILKWKLLMLFVRMLRREKTFSCSSNIALSYDNNLTCSEKPFGTEKFPCCESCNYVVYTHPNFVIKIAYEAL